MDRFEIIERKHWQHEDGRTASIYGAVPYYSNEEAAKWSVVCDGLVIRDNVSNEVGRSGSFATYAEAQAKIDKLNELFNIN